MSQEPNLFSAFKRPRETLGGLNANLYSTGTGIPQPSSAVKRSNSNSGANAPRPSAINYRQSILPPRTGGSLQRSSSGGNLVDMNSAANRRDSRAAFPSASSRKSYAPAPTPAALPNNRRSSQYSRPSMGAGLVQGSSFFTSSGGSALTGAGANKIVDPRPLRDPSYKGRISQQMMDYLVRNNFELEQKHALTPNAMKSPTQKDFIAMFQWLYHRLDPDYKFAKGIDHEAIFCLKSLKYPYINSITKSQLGAAGGPHWPTYLGMLHWMMELAQAMEQYESGDYDEVADEAGFDTFSSRVQYNYISQSYRDWLGGVDEDDFGIYKEEVVHAYEARSAENRERIQLMEAENEKLLREMRELLDENGESPLDKIKKELVILEKDVEKFKAFNLSINERCPRMAEANAKVRESLDRIREEIEALENEKRSLQDAVDKQGLTPMDIDRMNAEREKLVKGLEATAARLEEAHAAVADREAEALKKLELLEHAVKRYGELGYKIGVTSSGINGKSYELEIVPITRAAQNATEGSSGDDERLLYSLGVGYTPQQVLNMAVRETVKPALNKFRSDIAGRIHQAQDKSIENQDMLEQVQEALQDKADEVETLEAKLSSVNDEYNEIKETSAAETSASNAEIEKLERELQSMRVNAQNGMLAVEQRLQSITIERDQIDHAILTLREYYHTEVEKMLNDVVKFKLHVQTRLGTLDDDVAVELEIFQEEMFKANQMKMKGLQLD